MENKPSEIDLLRAVASAAKWAIESNADDIVGRDGRARVGFNWIAANGALNRALKALAEHYEVADVHDAQRDAARETDASLRKIGRKK